MKKRNDFLVFAQSIKIVGTCWNHAADQCLCFHYIDRTNPLHVLPKSANLSL